MYQTKTINSIFKIAIILFIVISVVAIGSNFFGEIIEDKRNENANYEAVRKYEYSAEVKERISEYDNAEDVYFVEGRARVKQNGKWGFIDEAGREAISLIYDMVYDFCDGYAKVQLDGKLGFVDMQGNEVTAIIYDNIYPFVDGIARVKKNRLYGFVDSQGQEIISTKYNTVDDFSEGYAAVGINDKYGYIDTAGNVVLPIIYDYADTFSEGYAYVKKDGKNMYINKKGEVVLTLDYDYLYTFSGGVAKVQRDDRFGFINTKGKQITPVDFDSASPFVSGVSKVEMDGKYGYVNREGQTVVPIIYDEIGSVQYNFIRARKGEVWCVYSVDGTKALDNMYYVGEFSKGRAVIGVYNTQKNKPLYGYANETLGVVVGAVFDEAESFKSDGTARVVYENQEYVIDINGNKITKEE